MADAKLTTVITPKDEPVRLSYVNLLTPRETDSGESKYGATILIPKTAVKTKAMIDAAVEAAIQAGISSRFNGKRPAMLNLPLHDGDGTRPSDGEPYGPECKGHWVLNATSRQQPGVIDRKGRKIEDATEIYSGMYACVSLNFAAYNNNKKGVGCYLNNVMKHSDGEALAGKSRPEDDFADLLDADADTDPLAYLM